MHAINPVESCARTLTNQGRSLLRLYSGNPNEQGFLFPKEILTQAYARYFQKQFYHPHPKGLLEARRAIAGYYQSQGASVDPEHLLLTSGTSESFLYLFSLLGEAGGNLLVPQPSYPLFAHIAEMAKLELRPYTLQEERGWSLETSALEAVADDRTRALLLVSPNNPTGAVHSQEETRQVVAWANTRGLPLICDEVFSEFYFGAGKFPRAIQVAEPELCFTLNGLSKMFALPALKLSWIAVSGKKEKVEAALDRLELFTDTFLTAHTPIQCALPELFAGGKHFLKDYVSEVGRRRSLALEILRTSPSLQVVEPKGGFYLMARFLHEYPGGEEAWVIDLMKKTGVFVHPGYFYDLEKGIHFVLSFLAPPKDLRHGLEAIVDFCRR